MRRDKLYIFSSSCTLGYIYSFLFVTQVVQTRCKFPSYVIRYSGNILRFLFLKRNIVIYFVFSFCCILRTIYFFHFRMRRLLFHVFFSAKYAHMSPCTSIHAIDLLWQQKVTCFYMLLASLALQNHNNLVIIIVNACSFLFGVKPNSRICFLYIKEKHFPNRQYQTY